MAKTAISLFIDDTHAQPPGQMDRLLDFCAEQGLRGKVSLIAALAGEPTGLALGRNLSAAEQAFLQALGRARELGFDTHMELMTHGKLWDFSAGRQRQGGPREGIWLYDPDIPKSEFRAYLGAILDHAAALGVTINGLSLPGCDCADCQARWADLRARGHSTISANAFAALLDLAEERRMGVDSIAVYSEEADADHPTKVVAERRGYRVFDVRMDMTVEDHIGFGGSFDADFYISEDGHAGRIAEVVLRGAGQCFFCAHWFDMNPSRPRGWQVFQEIIRRVNRHLGERIEWVKPSDYGMRLVAQGDGNVSQG